MYAGSAPNPYADALRRHLAELGWVERVAVLRDPAAAPADVGATQAVARSLGLRLQILSVGRPEEFLGAFQAARQAGADALIVLASGFFKGATTTRW